MSRTRPCADCGRTKRIAARDLCAGCYKRHRLAGTLRQYQSIRGPSKRQSPARPCLYCDRVLPHQGRGLCAACYSLLSRQGRLDSYPRLTWPRAELLAEWDHLRRSGVGMTEAARRIGISRDGLEKAIERAGKRVA